MRQRLSDAAESLGLREATARGRDRLVDLLRGDHSSSKKTRGQTDERNLRLLLAFVLRHDSNCLDVGANRGHILRDMRRLAPGGRHIAYEPLPHLCAKLVQRFPEVDVRQRALSNESGETTFVHVLGKEAYSGLKERRYPREVQTETIPITTERLDDSIPDGWLPDFVKIDVEGATGLVLRGAVETLRRAQPVMTFEHGRDAAGLYGVPDEDIYQLLCLDIGLRLFDMDGNGPLDLPQFKEGLATRWNWVAHP
jgi:FkbM family methyltransferase